MRPRRLRSGPRSRRGGTTGVLIRSRDRGALTVGGSRRACKLRNNHVVATGLQRANQDRVRARVKRSAATQMTHSPKKRRNGTAPGNTAAGATAATKPPAASTGPHAASEFAASTNPATGAQEPAAASVSRAAGEATPPTVIVKASLSVRSKSPQSRQWDVQRGRPGNVPVAHPRFGARP